MKEYLVKFEFKLKPGMSLITLWVHTAKLSQNDLDAFRTAEDYNIIKGEIKVSIAVNYIKIDVSGVGNQTNVKGTFNFTLNDKKIFKEDQEFFVKPNGRISFVKYGIQLPI